MRAAFTATLLLLLPPAGISAASAQALAPARPALETGEPNRGALPGRPADPAIEAQRVRAETRLKQREDQAKRTLRSICRGC